MKTIELKWIEDDNNVVAKQANTGLQDLIDTGVFKTLTSECKDDTLYITGEKDELDKAVMKIQKAYAEYGQIMIKEAKKEGGLRIESYDDNVQEIFDYTVKEFDKLKENKANAETFERLNNLYAVGCYTNFEEETYTIVGTSEVDPFDNKISNESPLAQAIMGKSLGEKATVVSESGNYEVKILNIK